MNLTLIAIITLGSIGLFISILLYITSQKFKVLEDPRLDDVEAALPGANCGGCGFAGCRNFAEACVKTTNFETLLCPVGGSDTMSKVASILGKEATKTEPKIAVLRCNGSCADRPRTSIYDGAASCTIANATFGGDTGCSYGCLGLADCVKACIFGALKMNEKTGLPEVDEAKCTSCGACVKTCPKNLFELRDKGPESKRIFVNCMNRDKGALAQKACAVACIGCGKCKKICGYEAIHLAGNLAYIDFKACQLCRQCVEVCPTKAITEHSFPPMESKDTKLVPQQIKTK